MDAEDFNKFLTFLLQQQKIHHQTIGTQDFLARMDE